MNGLKSVPGHEGYFVDRTGNVYSNKAVGGTIRKLKPSKSQKKDEHICVMFSHDRKKYMIHRLVYMTFVGPIPKGKIICHKDDNPLNNVVENLYAGTHKENHADAKRNGKKPIGEQSTSSKLTEKEVLEILELKGKMRNHLIANAFNINKSTVCDIFANRTWKHIQRSVEE